MDSFFGRYKNSLVLAIVLVAQFFLLAVQVRRPFPAATAKVDHAGVRALRYGVTTVVTPPESVLHKSGLSLRGVWSGYLDLVGVRQQNAELKEEVNRLRMEQAALAEDARQGERLQDLLAFRQHYVNTTVPAQVIGTSGTDHARVLLLDKGSDDGIAIDMPVITPDGIVGRIREVFPRSSQVLEISDPISAAGVLLEETRTRGILRGNTAGQPQVVNLMPDDRIKPGQLVLTSGGDQIFPRGLPVGVVDKIVSDPDNEPMVDVVLKPAANLGRLEEVLVVTGTGPTPTAAIRRDVAKSQSVAAAAQAAASAAQAAKEAAIRAAALADAQRASDVLAQRLPSRSDPANPDAPDASPDASPATSEAQAKPLHPPSALHPDHYSPTGVPSAASLTPGQRYAPLVEGTLATERHPPKAATTGVNATDTAPLGSNPAFSSAAAAMTAEHKAAVDARAAEAAKRYAALHPAPPSVPAPATVAEGSPAAPEAVRYTTRVNADGSTTRIPVPVAGAAPAVRFVNRVNADGTTTRVAVPATPATSPAATMRYVDRVNADGTTSRIAVPVTPNTASGAAVAPATRYVNRVNADGTTTRVAVPAVPAGSPAATVRYINRVNVDGTTSRIAVPVASTPAVRYVDRVNADGTTTRVAVPATPASGTASAVRYVTRTNADGTTTRVAVPASSPGSAPAAPATRLNADGTTSASPVRYTNRVNADGSTTRVAVPASVPAPSATSGAVAGSTTAGGLGTTAPRYTNRVNADGTITRVPISNPGTAGAAALARYTTRVNADGTTTRVPIRPAAQPPTGVGLSRPVTPAGIAASGTPAAPAAGTPTRVTPIIVRDGPLPSGTRPRSTVPGAISTAPRPAPVSPRPATTPVPSGTRPAAPRRKAPELVPDDGSRPPTTARPATSNPPATQPQEQP